MRALPLAAALCLAALAVPAAAQSDAECDRMDDLVYLIIDVDANGFTQLMEQGFNLTRGDYVRLDVTSEDDDRSHTVTLTGYDESVTVGPGGFTADQGCFQLDQAGSFKLRDHPSGDELPVNVLEGDSVGTGSGTGSDDDEENGAPALPFVALAAALVALAALRRR